LLLCQCVSPNTVLRTYRQTINQTLNTHLLSSSEAQADNILQKYDQARDYLAQTLEKEAGDKIKNNQRLLTEVEQKIANYNKTVQSINSCLESMQLDRKKLPTISPNDLAVAIAPTNIPKDSPVIEVESVEVSSEET
jgi:DNA-directed RNA polymerase subunit H (RpoH/RPB5)